MPDAEQPIFSIGAVARMLQLPPATIRTWETRYGLVVPQRTAGGQRLYSRAQVDQLRFVKAEVDRGSRPGQAHRLLAERLSERPVPRWEPRLSVGLVEPGEVAGQLLRQLLERGGFAVVAEGDAPLAVVGVHDAAGAALCRRLKEGGRRVIALVDEGAEEPAADAVLRLPVSAEELVRTARALAGR